MIIHLLRKPLASNTLGSLPCGVLAIDATRVPLAAAGEDPRLGGKGTWASTCAIWGGGRWHACRVKCPGAIPSECHSDRRNG